VHLDNCGAPKTNPEDECSRRRHQPYGSRRTTFRLHRHDSFRRRTARFFSMSIVLTSKTNPAWRVWILEAAADPRDPILLVAGIAGFLGMAAHTQRRIGVRFDVMPRTKTGAMESAESR
jgi:hypothetical protein